MKKLKKDYESLLSMGTGKEYFEGVAKLKQEIEELEKESRRIRRNSQLEEAAEILYGKILF